MRPLGWVELLAHLEVLLRRVRARPGAEGDEAHRTGRLAVLAGHLEQRPLVPLHQGQGAGQGGEDRRKWRRLL